MSGSQILGGVLIAMFIGTVGAITKASGVSWGEWAAAWVGAVVMTVVVVVGVMLVAGELG